MATVKPHHSRRSADRRGARRHGWRNLMLAMLLPGALLIVAFGHRLQAQAVTATSYGARIGCTCHYVAGRDLQDCRKDFEPGMALVTLSDNPRTHAITARVPLIANQTATFRDGAGCQLQSWAP